MGGEGNGDREGREERGGGIWGRGERRGLREGRRDMGKGTERGEKRYGEGD